MRMMQKTEMKQKIQSAISLSQKRCDYLRGCENSQQKILFNQAAGEIAAFSAVLQALNGNSLSLNISAGE